MKICTYQATQDYPTLCYGALVVYGGEYEVRVNGDVAKNIRLADTAGYVIGLAEPLVDRDTDNFIEEVRVGVVEIRKIEPDAAVAP